MSTVSPLRLTGLTPAMAMCRHLGRALIVLALWFGAATTIVAAEALRVDGQQLRLQANDRLEYRFAQATEDPALPPAEGEWRLLRERRGAGNFAGVSATLWFRLSLTTDDNGGGDWTLTLPSPHVASALLVLETPGAPPQVALSGLQAQEQGVAGRWRHPTFRIALADNQTHTVYLRVRSESLFQMELELWQDSAWRERELLEYTLLAAYFGLVAGLLAYNSFLAVRLRDTAYASYLGFGLSLVVFQLGNTGMGPHMLWPGHALLTIPLLSISTCLFCAMGLVFTLRFLRLGETAPRLAQVLRISSAAWIPVIASHAWLTPLEVSNLLIVPLGLWTAVLIQVAALLGVRLKTPGAAYFLLGWTAITMAGALRVLVQVGFLSSHPLLDNGLLLASAFEMLMLSLALADRIMAERKARATAEALRRHETAEREIAESALREKSSFMAAVAHDLQQPVYAISLAIESIHRQSSNGSSLEATKHMQSALQVADELLASLAMAVHLERSDLKPHIQTFSVQDMLDRIDSMFAPIAQQRGLRWRVTPSLALVHSDCALLERMLCNLLSNAFRYTKSGGVLLGCRQRAGHLLIQVWDTGPGIAPDEQELVFRMHQRGRHLMGQQQGLGLGLAIVKGCAELLGIPIELRSTLNKGSCFGLKVPCP